MDKGNMDRVDIGRGPYAETYECKPNPIAVDAVDRMAREGLTFRQAKEVIREMENLLGNTGLSFHFVKDVYHGAEDFVEDTIRRPGGK